MRVLLFPHAGSSNHGCEAIVRTTADFLAKQKIDLYSSNPESDRLVKLDEIVTVFSNNGKRTSLKSLKGLLLRAKAKFFYKDIDDLLLYDRCKLFKSHDVAISIGGDNYCYPGMIYILNEQCKAVDYYKIPRVIWGCSFDESLINDRVKEELLGYRAIFVRESVSKDILNSVGIQKNVFLYPDPAFTLKQQEVICWNGDFGKNGVIGLNISPLMRRYDSCGLLQEFFCELIKHILENTDKSIALIPHVIQEGNSDLDYMKQVYLRFKEQSDRLILINGSLNCMQLKHVISKCDMFVGCRTHATIAAYSTCVPTLVVGYSNKSKGIARDIFGDESKYVVPIDELKDKSVLVNKFKLIYDNLSKERAFLKERMPEYITRAYEGGIALARIINEIKGG